jgi:hypothetical protein
MDFNFFQILSQIPKVLVFCFTQKTVCGKN